MDAIVSGVSAREAFEPTLKEIYDEGVIKPPPCIPRIMNYRENKIKPYFYNQK